MLRVIVNACGMTSAPSWSGSLRDQVTFHAARNARDSGFGLVRLAVSDVLSAAGYEEQLGLVAARPIAADERIGQYTGTVLTRAQLEERYGDGVAPYVLAINVPGSTQTLFVDAANPRESSHMRYLNDAKGTGHVQNVRFEADGSVVATRPIAPGAELLVGYGDEYWGESSSVGTVDDVSRPPPTKLQRSTASTVGAARRRTKHGPSFGSGADAPRAPPPPPPPPPAFTRPRMFDARALMAKIQRRLVPADANPKVIPARVTSLPMKRRTLEWDRINMLRRIAMNSGRAGAEASIPGIDRALARCTLLETDLTRHLRAIQDMHDAYAASTRQLASKDVHAAAAARSYFETVPEMSALVAKRAEMALEDVDAFLTRRS
jgi:hypothetical protein